MWQFDDIFSPSSVLRDVQARLRVPVLIFFETSAAKYECPTIVALLSFCDFQISAHYINDGLPLRWTWYTRWMCIYVYYTTHKNIHARLTLHSVFLATQQCTHAAVMSKTHRPHCTLHGPILFFTQRLVIILINYESLSRVKWGRHRRIFRRRIHGAHSDLCHCMYMMLWNIRVPYKDKIFFVLWEFS